jgi:formyl-CoA transferase
MMDTLVTLMFMEPLEAAIAQGLPLRNGNNTRSGPTGLYHTRDADIIITAASEDQWGRLCSALDAQELYEDPRFSTSHGRGQHVEALRQEIQHRLGQYTRDEAVQRLQQSDVPCAPVRTASEVMADDHFYQRGTLGPMHHAKLAKPVDGVVPGFPVVFSDGPLPTLPGAPTLGMHNQDILGTLLGLSDEQLQQLQMQGVI